MGAPTRPAESLVDEPEPSAEELAEIEAAWEAEVLWRAAEHDAGRAQSVPWEQVRAELFGKRR